MCGGMDYAIEESVRNARNGVEISTEVRRVLDEIVARAGKGFAVVAHEVKELARQTADATADIGQRIQAIQSTTGASVESMNRIVEVIKTINEASRTIAAAVEEQSVTTRKISESISTVVHAS